MPRRPDAWPAPDPGGHPVQPSRMASTNDDGAEIVLRTVGLTKRFDGVTAVDGLNLTVLRGEVVGLLGPNGAGKTTTVNLILGLLTPTEGRVELFGEDLASARPDGRRESARLRPPLRSRRRPPQNRRPARTARPARARVAARPGPLGG